MSRVVLLDTGTLGMVFHPRPNRDVVEWVRSLLLSGAEILVPEIADYEVRRELLGANKVKGITRLDELKRTMGYVRITTDAMLEAADFWSAARIGGEPQPRTKPWMEMHPRRSGRNTRCRLGRSSDCHDQRETLIAVCALKCGLAFNRVEEQCRRREKAWAEGRAR